MKSPILFLLLLFLTILLTAAAERSEEEVRLLYDGWLIKHNKPLNALDDESQSRFEAFQNNLLYIDGHNAAAEAGAHTFRLGLNRFADLTNEEYRAQFLGYRSSAGRRRRLSAAGNGRYKPSSGDSLPVSIDWREKGAVAEIKDQGSCGSCWAFSTVSAVEAINKIVTGDMITLSEQELVDCDREFNEGCNGGLMDYAFEFIIRNGGIDTEEDYPYKNRDDSCDNYRKNAKVVIIDSYEDVRVNDEIALKTAVARQPVSVAIEGSGRAFQLYESVVFYCKVDLLHLFLLLI